MNDKITYLSGPQNETEKRERINAALVTLMPMAAFLLGVFWIFKYGIGPFEIYCFLFFYILGEIGAEVGLHRYFSHRAFRAGPFFKRFITVLASIGGKGSVFEFAAVHRRHHLYSDRKGDPHSPHQSANGFKNKVSQFFHAYYLWIYRIRMNPSEHTRILDLLQDEVIVRWGSKRLYYTWLILGVFLPGICGLIYFRNFNGFVAGLLWGGGIRLFFQQHTAFAINSVGHLWGQRPFKTRDESRNNFVLAYLMFGVGWHNNHHAFPYTYSNQFKWWQLDLCGWFLKFCQYLNLVDDLKFPTKNQIDNYNLNENVS